MYKAKITGSGIGLPQKILTNNDLAKIVDTNDEWITTRTGIKQRYVAKEESTSDLALIAAKQALENANLKAQDLDLIIVATSTPDYLNFPSTACVVQGRLGAINAACFDLSAACSGFVYALSTASKFIEAKAYSKILVIAADTLTKYVDWQDRNTCVLFGDGAGAVVLEASQENNGIISSLLFADGLGANLLINPSGGSKNPISCDLIEQRKNFITMDGKNVFKFSTRVIVDSIEKILQKTGVKKEEIDLIIPHQANIRIIDYALDKFKLSKDKAFMNIDKYGNTSAASIPIAMHEALNSGKINDGNIIITVGFGGGLTWGVNLIRW